MESGGAVHGGATALASIREGGFVERERESDFGECRVAAVGFMDVGTGSSIEYSRDSGVSLVRRGCTISQENLD